MDRYTKSICDGMTNYLRILGTSRNMIYEKDEAEWIAPMPGTPGPAMVFEVRLNEQNADLYLEQAVSKISAGQMPAKWMVMPTYTPSDLMDRMVAKGFTDTRLRQDGEEEPGMALDLEEYIPAADRTALNIIQVRDYDNFGLWIKTVNQFLHGWDMLLAPNCFHLLSHEDCKFYMGLCDNIPVATIATMKYGEDASIEFVSVDREYRRRGFGRAMCQRALNDLKQNNSHLVTLRSSEMAIGLYEGLGFRKFFTVIGTDYPVTGRSAG